MKITAPKVLLFLAGVMLLPLSPSGSYIPGAVLLATAGLAVAIYRGYRSV